ncbi:MAG TPA: S8 family serine peptidase [Candidatus Limnocylindrales bacterium]|nr:S8 family serine peptidase [Candidatus Limnocylindrales bacterium]
MLNSKAVALVLFCFLTLEDAFDLQAASALDTIGVTLLRQVDATLTGSGISIAQPEGPADASTPIPFEVNPAAVGRSASVFNYISADGTANTFPNSAGAESGHADAVGANLYSPSTGVGPQIAPVDNYEATYFFNSIIGALVPPAISDPIVNQSFVFQDLTAADQATVEQDYDSYAANHNTLFVSGVGNGGAVMPPATSFNGIGVSAYGGSSSVGPTSDGRSKPDVTAPAGATSFATPYVSGSAAVLLQAAIRGDGGTGTSSRDVRTLKALLINGAVKPAGWINGPTVPLDARYGAGVVNLFNSWEQLRGGQHAFVEATSNNPGSPHPPGSNPNNEPTLIGWDYNSISNPGVVLTKEQVNHYYFNLSGTAATRYTLSSTLVWNRQAGQTAINDLNLFLYNASNNNLVAACTSSVDNVEHLFVTGLAPARYDLQVEKNPTGRVSQSENYALAFDFFNLALNVARTNQTIAISWPLVPAGFTLQSAPSLTPPVSWSPVAATVAISSNQNAVVLPAIGGSQFFRLQGP